MRNRSTTSYLRRHPLQRARVASHGLRVRFDPREAEIAHLTFLVHTVRCALLVIQDNYAFPKKLISFRLFGLTDAVSP